MAEYWHQVVKINNYQRTRIANLVDKTLNRQSNKKIGVLGWAFKKNTNDSRESSSIYISLNLISKGY